ncbi:MAG: PQ-loop domain-containing transporter [Ignavibacteria bacterium]
MFKRSNKNVILELYIGFGGTFLVLVAYIPQVYHLVKEKCSAGISRKAFLIWQVSSIMLFIHSIIINDIVFVLLQGVNMTATAMILIFAQKYKNELCSTHQHKLNSSEIG